MCQQSTDKKLVEWKYAPSGIACYIRVRMRAGSTVPIRIYSVTPVKQLQIKL